MFISSSSLVAITTAAFSLPRSKIAAVVEYKVSGRDTASRLENTVPYRIVSRNTLWRMPRKRLTSRESSTSLSVKSLGTGEMEKVTTPTSADPSSPVANAECDDVSSFVVRNFRALTSKWLQPQDTVSSSSSSETMEEGTKEAAIAEQDSHSSLSEKETEEKVEYDLTTDLSYHDSSEKEGADLVCKALTPEEQSAMPDAFMPLRHYRAEKVGRLVENAVYLLAKSFDCLALYNFVDTHH